MIEQNETQPENIGDRPAEISHFIAPEDEVFLKDILLIPWKRKGVVAVCTAICVLAAIFLCIATHPKYKATATIELNEGKSSATGMLSDLAAIDGSGSDDLNVKINTEIAVIKNNSIALAVMSKMGMIGLQNTDRLSKAKEPVNPEDLPAKQREGLIGNFEAHLKVEPIKDSRLIAITYTSTDPVEAAKVANQVVVEYKAYLLSSNFNASKDVSQWLSSQLGDLSNQVTKAQLAVADFERTHNLSAAMPGLSALGSGSTSNGGSIQIPELTRLAALNDEVTQAEAVRLGREETYRLITTENPDLISTLGSSSIPGLSSSTVMSQGNGLDMLNTLRQQEAAARVAYASAETKYGSRNPRLTEISNQLKSLHEQIQNEIRQIKQRAKNDLVMAQQNEQALRSTYEAQKLVTSKMNDEIVQLGILMEQARSKRELYDILYTKLQAANIDAGNSATNVTIADPARTPGQPYVPRTSSYIFLGVLGGLFLGIGMAYLLESMDDTLTDSFQVEKVSNLPVLGMIPSHRVDAKPREGALATESSPFLIAPESATAESLRSLRSGLILSGIGRKLKVIAISSALPGEGKSYLTYNLGLAFAATGLKVLIIDADLRRSRQHSLFRVARENGLVDILAGLESFKDAVVQHPVEPHLALLPAGRHSPLASEILESGDFGKVIETAKEQFDLVLVDTAPVLPVADAIIVGTYCDGMIGVLRAGRTSRKALRRFVQTLARSRVHLLGMVIEAVDMSATEYRSVYGYNMQSYYGDK